MSTPRDRGFTMIEALVAFVIVSLVLGAGYAGMAGGLKATARAEDALDKLAQAEAVLARIGVEIPLDPGETVLAEEPWEIRVAIEAHRRDDALLWDRLGLRPYAVAVSVSGGTGAPVTLETLRLGP